MTARSRPKIYKDTRRAFMLVVGAWVACAAGVFNNWLMAPDPLPPDQCAGLGFGCVLTPQDNVEFMAMLFAVPVTIVWFCVGAIATTLLGRFSNLKWCWTGIQSLRACLLVGVVTVRAIERLI